MIYLQVIKPGIIDHRPVKGDTVVVRAVGRLEDGKEVDVHDELTFTVGDSEVRLNVWISCTVHMSI